MKWFRLIPVLVAACLLAGCSTTLSKKDRQVLIQHNVPAPIYDKMVPMEFISLPEVTVLSHQGVPPKFIVHYLWATRAAYHVTQCDICRLRRSGVSEDVIYYILRDPPIYTPSPFPYYTPRPFYYTGANTFPPPYYPYGNATHWEPWVHSQPQPDICLK